MALSLQLRCGCGAAAIDPRTQAAAAVRLRCGCDRSANSGCSCGAAAVRLRSIRELRLQLRCGCGAAAIDPRTQAAAAVRVRCGLRRRLRSMPLRSIRELRLQLRCGCDRSANSGCSCGAAAVRLRCCDRSANSGCSCGAAAVRLRELRRSAAAVVRLRSIRELRLQLRCGCNRPQAQPSSTVLVSSTATGAVASGANTCPSTTTPRCTPSPTAYPASITTTCSALCCSRERRSRKKYKQQKAQGDRNWRHQQLKQFPRRVGLFSMLPALNFTAQIVKNGWSTYRQNVREVLVSVKMHMHQACTHAHGIAPPDLVQNIVHVLLGNLDGLYPKHLICSPKFIDVLFCKF